jgi:hypothetical protein
MGEGEGEEVVGIQVPLSKGYALSENRVQEGDLRPRRAG